MAWRLSSGRRKCQVTCVEIPILPLGVYGREQIRIFPMKWGLGFSHRGIPGFHKGRWRLRQLQAASIR